MTASARSRLARTVRRRVRALPPVERAADATRARRAAAAVRRSGWFDEAWYREQAGDACPDGEDALEHYLAAGHDAGWQPHPLFDPGHYLAHSRAARRSVAEPFTEFVTRGAVRGDDPHPLFETAAYLAQAPRAGEHPRGPFGHYLAHGHREGHWPSSVLRGARLPPPTEGADPYLDLARRTQRAHRRVVDHTALERSQPTFDHDTAAVFVARMRDHAARRGDTPLISVIVPTRDRAGVLVRAIDSVLAQTHAHLELLVVDDGSTDDTAAVVAAYDDERLRYLPQANAGVSRARNRGLEEARGALVAYLDSDNAWVPEFLEVMGAFLDAEGLRAGYAGIELHTADGIEYRGLPLDREALAERNYIDLNTVVHERGLADEVGGFDEGLRRVVDWDLLLRMAGVVELGYAPFVGARYDAGDERDDRITAVESIGYRHVVRQRHLVDLDAAPGPVRDRTSVLVATRTGDEAVLARVAALLDGADRADLEVVVVDDGTDHAHALRLRALGEAHERVVVDRVADPTSLPVALNLAASRASGDVLVVLDASLPLRPDDAAVLAAAVRDGDAELAQPTLLNPVGRIRSTGQRLGPGGCFVAVGTDLGEDDGALSTDTARDAVEIQCFAIAAPLLRRLGGLDALFVHGGGELDLCLRARDAGARVRWVPGVAVPLEPSRLELRGVPTEADQRELRRRHPHPGPATVGPGTRLEGLRVAGLQTALGTDRPGPRRWAPVYVRDRREGEPLRWSIKTRAPDVAERDTWGDWHFGTALARALRRQGQHAVVDCRRAWHGGATHLDDVALALLGTRPYDPNPAQVNLAWVISHPDARSREELAVFDRVFVASEGFARELADRWPELDVAGLLQCTDPERFRPHPDPALAEDVLFVGNSRGHRRRIVADALEAGLEPAVYGSGWEGLIPDRLIRGRHVPNEDLPRYYASARVVLNDHWEDMRRRGFVSNRIFDALACGATVVTDEVEGLPEVGGGRLRTYDGADDLARVVAEVTRDARGDVPAATAWPGVWEHTFDARARELVAAAKALGAGR